MKTVIKMALEAGLPIFNMFGKTPDKEALERFAALAAEVERKRCLSMIDAAMIPNPTTSMFDAGVNSALGMVRSAIEGMK